MPTQKTKLSNGLTVLTEELRQAPVVALQAWVNVGSADETEKISGIAHLHEHMLFKGTPTRGVGAIAGAVEAIGGEINAWTSFDQTVYHLVLASSELTTGLDILSDALKNSLFDEQELEREIEVVVEEIQRAQDSPTRRLTNALFQLVYQRHPYRRPVLGTPQTVRSLGRAEMLDFFRHHYRPERVVFVAAGDFETKRFVDQVDRYFGDWKSVNGVPVLSRATEPPQQECRAKVLREDVQETRYAVAWRIPEVSHQDIAAVDALSIVLGHGESSLLYQDLRRRQQLVNDVYAHAYTPRDPGLFMAGCGLDAENSEAALVALLEQCFRTRHTRVKPDDLEKAKTIILSESAYQKETVQGEARKLGFYEVVAGDYRFEDRYHQQLKALTPQDVQVVAERYLTAAPSVVLQTDLASKTPDEDQIRTMVEKTFARARGGKPSRSQPGALGVHRIKLTSGATLLVRPESGPVVAVRAVGLGGQRFETEENQGIGYLFASLWGLQTSDLNAQRLAERVARLGGSLAAFSGRNTMGLRAEFVADHALAGLDLFCDVLVRPRFEEEDLERERAVIKQRIRSRIDNPAGVAFDSFSETLFPQHPYGRRATGTEASVSALSLDQIVEFGSPFVSPDRLVIAVVGDIEVSEVERRLNAELKKDSATGLPAEPTADPRPNQARSVHRELDRQQSHVIVGGMGTTLTHPDRHALEVMTTVLSGQSGRLFVDLRDQQSLAYSISSSSLEGIDPGHVLVHMGTGPEKVERALRGVHDHLERLRTEPVPEDELRRAKRYLVGTHAIDLQRGGARAMLMALGETFGLGYDDYDRYAQQIEGVSAQDVLAAAARYLDPKGLVEVVVGPKLA